MVVARRWSAFLLERPLRNEIAKIQIDIMEELSCCIIIVYAEVSFKAKPH